MSRDSLVVLVCSLALYGYFLDHPDQNPNVHSRWNLVRAIVEDHTLTIDRFHTNTLDKCYFGGHYYSDKAPGSSMLGVPIYATLRWFCNTARIKLDDRVARNVTRFIVISIPSALLVVLVYRAALAIGCPRLWAGALVLGFAAGTSVLPYATLYYGHSIGAFWGFLACWLAIPALRAVKQNPQAAGSSEGRGTGDAAASVDASQAVTRLEASAAPEPPGDSTLSPSRVQLLLAGLCIGIGVVSEYPVVLIGAVLGLVLLVSLRPKYHILYYIAGGVPCCLLLGAYVWQVSGGSVALTYANEVSSEYQEGMAAGMGGVTYPRLHHLWTIMLSPARGLFVFSPFLLVAFVGVVRGLRHHAKDPRFWLCVSVSALFVLFNASYYMPHGGWACGPRHLIPALPFMTLLCAWALRVPTPQWLPPVFSVLVVASVAKLVLATTVSPHAPETIVNPLISFWFPLGYHGITSVNLGTWAGLSGLWTLLPIAFLLMVGGYEFLHSIKTLEGASTEPAPFWPTTPTKRVAWAAVVILTCGALVGANFRYADEPLLATFDQVNVCAQAGKPHLAAEALRRAVSRQPVNSAEQLQIAMARYSLAGLYVNQLRYDEAAEQMREVLKACPNFAWAHNAMGLILAKQGQIADAEAEFRTALRYQPDLESAQANLKALREGRSRMSLPQGLPDAGSL